MTEKLDLDALKDLIEADRYTGEDYDFGPALIAAARTALPGLVERVEVLEGALKHEVANCPMCKGDGKTAETFKHILGEIKKGEAVDCPRCSNARAALKGDQA